MKISIVICTHNPDIELIAPLLKATETMHHSSEVAVEYIMIDNASSDKLDKRSDIARWKENLNNARVIREDNPGLINARIRAIRESDGNVIIFFDDDNLPDADYLKESINALELYPFVGVWGPGNVSVQWLPGGDSEVQKQFADFYQEHHQNEVTYALDFPSPSTMPYGTGMIIRREVADAYLEWFEKGEHQTTGRIGNSLASCEDLQICWIGMDAGWAVGRSPGLKISHIITAEKAQWDYLARLRFGIYSSHSTALKEALPEKYSPVTPSSARLAGYITFQWLSWLTKRKTMPLNVYLSKVIGQAAGAWKAEDVPLPGWMKWLTSRLYNV